MKWTLELITEFDVGETKVQEVARGLSHDLIRTLAKRWVTGRMDRAKWCLWNGKAVTICRRCKTG